MLPIAMSDTLLSAVPVQPSPDARLEQTGLRDFDAVFQALQNADSATPEMLTGEDEAAENTESSDVEEPCICTPVDLISQKSAPTDAGSDNVKAATDHIRRPVETQTREPARLGRPHVEQKPLAVSDVPQSEQSLDLKQNATTIAQTVLEGKLPQTSAMMPRRAPKPEVSTLVQAPAADTVEQPQAMQNLRGAPEADLIPAEPKRVRMQERIRENLLPAAPTSRAEHEPTIHGRASEPTTHQAKEPDPTPVAARPVVIDAVPQSSVALERLQTHQAASESVAPPHVQHETVRHVANQLAVVMLDPSGATTEISLNPEELGRVRLHMSTADNAITLTVSAERQDTTDLLRRNIETLAQEFRDLGYSDVSFAFGHGRSPDDPQNNADQSAAMVDEDVAETVMPLATDAVTSAGLDIRL